MTVLLVLAVWTACAAVLAPFVGRVLAHGGAVSRTSPGTVHLRPLPTRRHPLVLR